MIEEIIKKYKKLSDALVWEVVFCLSGLNKRIEITIKCMNSLNDYAFETVKFSLIDVLSFRFIKKERESSTVINEALLVSSEGNITFDFFSVKFENQELKVNVDSDFKVTINY